MLNLFLYLSLCINSTDTLRWEDFKGAPDPILVAKGFSASTATSWTMDSDEDSNGNLKYVIRCNLLPEQSWVNTDCKDVLLHETTHYNISRIWAKKCQQRLGKLKNPTNESVLKIFNHCWKECTGLHALFDRETQHGKNRIIERIWEKNISYDAAKL